MEQPRSMTIGEVLSLLTPEFPDVSISKIRFLESEGLIAPQRAPSGYRRFSGDDVVQLRWILLAQRDHYLPLRVIKSHLAGGTLQELVEPKAEPEVEVIIDPVPALSLAADDGAAAPDLPQIDPRAVFNHPELVAASELSEAQVNELLTSGVIAADPAGRFSGADVLVCQAFAVLRAYGVESRHLRQVKNAASRDSALITGAVNHLPEPQRGDEIRTMLHALSSAHYWQVIGQLHRQPPAPVRRPGR